MLKVQNKKVISRLSKRTLAAKQKKNIVVVIAIMLTAMMFTALFTIMSDFEYVNYSGCCYYAQNTPISQQTATKYPQYGYANRQATETSGSQTPVYYPANYTGTSTSLGGYGAFRVNGSKYLLKPSDGYIRNGNYRLIFTW